MLAVMDCPATVAWGGRVPTCNDIAGGCIRNRVAAATFGLAVGMYRGWAVNVISFT